MVTRFNASEMPSAFSLYNGMQTCRHEHEHYSTPWTIYVVDPQVATDVNKYGDALYPIDSFDTKEEVENLYRLRAFSEPNGPPSWSMVVEGGAIAVFQGGKFGYPSVAPKWEDPAAHNGGEFRFTFSRGVDPFKFIDGMFVSLIAWMASHPVYDDATILGLFIKNVKNDGISGHNIQARLWVSEIPDESFERIAMGIANDFAEVLEDCGVKGIIAYKGLSNLIQRSHKPPAERQLGQESRTGDRYFKIIIPRDHSETVKGQNAENVAVKKNGVINAGTASPPRA